MLFNSMEFALFFPLVFIGFYALKINLRGAFLLGCSYFFYMSWRWEFIFLLLGSTLVDFFCSRKLAKESLPSRRKIFLWISLCTNLGLLCYFKYIGFFSGMANELFESLKVTRALPNLHPLLPVGISFYTFQTMGYTIDVYRRKIKPEKNFYNFALYVSFFPQLVAGPIERAGSLLPQLRKLDQAKLNYERIVHGLTWIGIGLFKKIVIADNLAQVVGPVYASPGEYHEIYSLFATFCFTFQLYCDFSGYSDIAVGTAKFFNVDLINNFSRPFQSTNISDFWRRLHVSLGLWLREYVYIPLGGGRGGQWKHYRNVTIVFLLSGFWHGGSWHYILWGALSAFFYVFGAITLSNREKLIGLIRLDRFPRILRVLLSLKVFFLYFISMPLFRADTTEKAFSIYRYIYDSLFSIAEWDIWREALSIGLGFNKMMILLALILGMETIHTLQEMKFDTYRWLRSRKRIFRYFIYLVFVLILILLGSRTGQEFVYFRF